ncbi:MAG: ATP-binding protein, partial [Desulfocapsaceae bacterium]|nr:ATP-binding protein [Desulfocapsaceae bacterium]
GQKHNCPLLTLLKKGKSRILHTTLNGLRGEYLLTLSPLTRSIGSEKATLLVARDMTEEERLHAEAIRASQLASIGELAAGVAHEINNPINGILNYAQVLEDLELSKAGEEITHRIIAESRRIEGIVKNLLDLSRHSSENPEPVNMQELLLNCLDLVKHQLHEEEIRIETDFAPRLPPAFCNGSQIKQVVLNTISNSRYALNQKYQEPSPDKKISLKTRLITRKDKPYIRIAITDFGTGIQAHVLEKVFDPFYSTKPHGEGTGLGLSISYGLVRDNGGHIRILSEPDQFTTIRIDLPVVQGVKHGKL